MGNERKWDNNENEKNGIMTRKWDHSWIDIVSIRCRDKNTHLSRNITKSRDSYPLGRHGFD